MSLSAATTDADAVDGLVARVTSYAMCDVYGQSRRRSFGDSRAGRRNRGRLRWGFEQCCEWYRTEGRETVAFDGRDVVRSAVSSYLLSMFAGWLLSWVAGWLFEVIVSTFIDWILSDESAAFREVTA